MNTILRGNAAEAAVLNALIQADVGVLIPFGGGFPFDLGVLSPAEGEVLRVQVKSGRIRNGCVLFNTCSTDHGRGRQDYRGRADLIAVHVPDASEIYLVPVDDCPSFTAVLRLNAPRNNQRMGIRFAEDYTLDVWLRSARGSPGTDRGSDYDRGDLSARPAAAGPHLD
ncbi:MAG: group I intron-associated PD-(D/E)XK endonuclease [Solirubrobacteraceae bacterium]